MGVQRLGIVFKDTDRPVEADLVYRHALELARRAYGSEHPQVAAIFHNMAGLQHVQGHYVEGEPYARQALDLRYRGDGPSSTGAAGDLAVLGAILLGQHRYSEAETVLTRSLTIWESRYGPLHYEVAVVLHFPAPPLEQRLRTLRDPDDR